MSEPVILASGSASRLSVLQNAGVTVRAIRPNVDEDAAKSAFRSDGLPVRDQAMALAELKAVKISRTETGLVIGGDQMLNLDETGFDKPENLDEAKGHLKQLAGKTHILETALVVCENGIPVWRHLARPKLTIRALTDEFIERYLALSGPDILTTVGAYKLEGLGAQLFTRIEGDYFSVLGLPLLPLLDYLRTRGALST